MAFGWPYALLLLLALPALLAGYLWALRRRKRRAVPYSSIALVRAAAPGRATWKRHAPVALFLVALAALGTAAARPQARVTVPVSESAVIIALDVSGSMCATDVDPNRLAAAQAAVRSFVKNQDSRTKIGLVVFSGSAQLAVAPTTQREELTQALDSLTTGRGTTIGAAILKSIDAISQIDPSVAPSDPSGTGTGAGPGAEGPAGPDPSTGAAPTTPVQPGNYAPEIVVLLTDGANTRGITPVEAAKVAAARGVRVYPIGFGTTNPTSLVCTAQQLGGSGFDQFRGGGGGGGGFGGGFAGGGGSRASFLVADEPTLRQVAATTGGTYFSASAAEELQAVLADLPRHVQTQTRDVELTAAFVAAAVLLLLGGAFAAVRWTTFPS